MMKVFEHVIDDQLITMIGNWKLAVPHPEQKVTSYAFVSTIHQNFISNKNRAHYKQQTSQK